MELHCGAEHSITTADRTSPYPRLGMSGLGRYGPEPIVCGCPWVVQRSPAQSHRLLATRYSETTSGGDIITEAMPGCLADIDHGVNEMSHELSPMKKGLTEQSLG